VDFKEVAAALARDLQARGVAIETAARVTAIAFAGAVVSNPMAKNTTSRSGLSWAMRTASSGA